MNVLKESSRFYKRYMPAWLTVILLGFITCFAGLLLPQVIQLIIDRIVGPLLGAPVAPIDNNVFKFLILSRPEGDYWGMFANVLIVCGILLFIRYAGHYVRWNVSHFYGVRAEKDMRQAVFAKMMSQNSIVMARYTSGDLMSIANSDPVALKDFFSQHFSVLLDQFLVIFLAIYFLLRINWTLIIIPFVLGVATLIVMVFYIRVLRVRYNEIRESSINLNSCVQENINGVRIIRAFSTEQIEVDKFNTRNEKYRESFLKQAKTVSRYQMIFMAMGQTVNLASLIIGVILSVKGLITLGEFTTFLSYVTMINNPLIGIANVMSAIQNSMICGARSLTFVDTSNIIIDPPKPAVIEGKPDIRLTSACVSLDGVDALTDINIDIPYGKKVGIMGKTGSGKSVLIKTMPRFFEVTHGQAYINGRNVKDYRVEDVRKQFSYVMQDVFLFSNTVDANIAFYDMDAPHEKVVECAVSAQADGFIHKLSDGYDTIVGERGLGLSGGQKQRISIARALLKDAPVLLFDDSTSALDLETERNILNELYDKYNDRTVIISSHRATSVMDCDEILFMEGGRIAERGTHQQLLDKKGKYYEVYSGQLARAKEAIE